MALARMVGILLAAGVIMTGCSDDSQPERPTSDPPPPVPSTPSSTATPSRAPWRSTAPAGTSGMTVRYLDSDGKIKTVRVEDFPG
jgi:hypothetical protein